MRPAAAHLTRRRYLVVSLAATAAYAVGPGGGYMSLSASAAARRLQDDGRWIDQLGNEQVRPPLADGSADGRREFYEDMAQRLAFAQQRRELWVLAMRG